MFQLKFSLRNNQLLLQIYNIPSGTKAIEYNILKPIFNQTNAIICGDFNAKNRLWGSPKNDPQGDNILDLIDNNLTVLNDGSGTHLNRDGSLSHLDLTIANNNIAPKCTWNTMDDSWNSDHIPIEITFNEIPLIEQAQMSKFKFKKADWETFKMACKA